MVLSSLNSIANLLTSNRRLQRNLDLLFHYALKLNVFECIFRWNFVFTGADLEAFKLKELQFYDTLVTGNGKYYLRHSEFALPVLATLHYCAIRSCLAVERVLLRTLNSICAALCSQYPEPSITNHNAPLGGENTMHLENDELLFFRRLCLGLMDSNEMIGCRSSAELDGAGQTALPLVNQTTANNLKLNEYVDWSMAAESKSSYPPAQASLESSIHEKAPSIDSIFDLLVPFVFREGELGWQARDALLLVSTYSLRDEGFSYAVAQHSSVCPVLATGLATLYAELPRRLVNNNLPESWPSLMQTLDEYEQNSPKFSEFFDALEFCQSVLEVAHPLIQSSLLHYIHSGFFVSVLGFSLTKSSVEDVVTATVYLKQLILHTTKSALLPVLLRFLLTRMPEEVQTSKVDEQLQNKGVHTDSVHDSNSNLSDQYTEELENINGYPGSGLGPTYMDLLISRLQYCNTLLGVATLSLFNTLLGLHCEDVMLYLVFRYLVPFRDSLLSLGWSWPEPSSYAQAAGEFLDLIAAYDDISHSSHADKSQSVVSQSTRHALHESVAELNLDDEPEMNGVDGEWSPTNHVKSEHLNSVDVPLYVVKHSSSAPKSVSCTMEALMPVHSEFILSPSCNSISGEFLQQNQPSVPSSDQPTSTDDEPHRRTYLTPDDWFNYTSWARDAIRSRSHACADWRLTYDSVHPTASQLAGFEEHISSTLPICESEVSRQQMALQPNGNRNLGFTALLSGTVAAAHAQFNCFTIKHPTVEQMKEKAGEKKAHALRMAVCKLDIDAEFDLDGSSNEVLPQYSERCPELSLKMQEVNRSHHGTSQSQTERPAALLTDTCTDTEGIDCDDSGIDVTRPLHKSSSDYQVQHSGLLKSDHTEHHVKSWYCLSYLDGTFLDSKAEDIEKIQSHTEASDGRSGLTQEINQRSSSRRSVSEANSSTNHDTQIISGGSDSEDLNKFIDCLNKLSPQTPNSGDASQRHSLDLENYFRSSQADPVALAHDQSPNPCDGVEVHDTLVSNASCRNSSLSSEENNFKQTCFEPETASSLEPGIGNDEVLINSNGMHTEDTGDLYGSCFPEQDNSRFGVRPSSLHSLGLYIQAMPYEPVYDAVSSSSVQYLNTLLRRQSTGSRALSVDKSATSRRTSSKSEPGPRSQLAFPTLGPFLSTVLARLESMQHNCFYANLYLTNLLSNLAAYPIPLLRAVLLYAPPPKTDDPQDAVNPADHKRVKTLQETFNQLPHAALSAVRKQLDAFVLQYATYSPLRSEVTFMDLVADAKHYFRSAAESTKSTSDTNGLSNGYLESDLVTNFWKQSSSCRRHGDRAT
ncbi:FTS and Hook-interacting protein homolog [Clonorchis sinensis]|uniref:FTS and Hook-interacting protein homolog n=1 Tax=Clonorchis sinensis TaxID=79923 RepID=G7YAQ8_CLOSI|nr:FTS and Hook-interacting protein homolog [Clonorchis sinensis]